MYLFGTTQKCIIITLHITSWHENNLMNRWSFSLNLKIKLLKMYFKKCFLLLSLRKAPLYWLDNWITHNLQIIKFLCKCYWNVFDQSFQSALLYCPCSFSTAKPLKPRFYCFCSVEIWNLRGFTYIPEDILSTESYKYASFLSTHRV